MNINEKLNLIKRNAAEIVGEEELNNLIKKRIILAIWELLQQEFLM